MSSVLISTRLGQRSVRFARCLHTTAYLRDRPTTAKTNGNDSRSPLAVDHSFVRSTTGSNWSPSLSFLHRSWRDGSGRAKWGLAAGAVMLFGAWFLSGDDGRNDPVLGRPNPADREYLRTVPASNVYAFCSSPKLIELSEPLFNLCRKIPIVANFTDVFARKTFFAQFFAAETAEESEHEVWQPLRGARVGVLTAHNIEAETDHSLNSPDSIREHVEGTLHAIETVGKFGMAHSTKTEAAAGDTRCWVRTKISGLVPDPQTMVRASEYITSLRKGSAPYPGIPEDGDFDRLMNGSGLRAEDREALHAVYKHLEKFMRRGQKYAVRIIVDAEQSWYQPAVDVMTEQLMRQFNDGRGPAVVCASFQAYLRRNSDLITSQINRAKDGGYKLVFKQVRGAYMPYERERWAALQKKGPPPVWGTKAETDKSYANGMWLALQAIHKRKDDPAAADVAVIFATHNEISVEEAIRMMTDLGLGKVDRGQLFLDQFTANRVAFAQIYGMKDGLTNRIAAKVVTSTGLPVVCKSATYGTLQHALPNLSRRAAENKTVMEGRGGAIAERKRLGRELCRRFVPFYHSEY